MSLFAFLLSGAWAPGAAAEVGVSHTPMPVSPTALFQSVVSSVCCLRGKRHKAVSPGSLPAPLSLETAMKRRSNEEEEKSPFSQTQHCRASETHRKYLDEAGGKKRSKNVFCLKGSKGGKKVQKRNESQCKSKHISWDQLWGATSGCELIPAHTHHCSGSTYVADTMQSTPASFLSLAYPISS